jgi:hypothetical protein
MKKIFLIFLLLQVRLLFPVFAQIGSPVSIPSVSASAQAGGMHFTMSLGQVLGAVDTIQGPDSLRFQKGFAVGYSNTEELDSSVFRYRIGRIPTLSLFVKEANYFYLYSDTLPKLSTLSYRVNGVPPSIVEAWDSLILIKDTVHAFIRFRIPTTINYPFSITFLSHHSQTQTFLDSQRVEILPLRNPSLETYNFGIASSQKHPDLTENRSYLIAIDDTTNEQVFMNGQLRTVRDVEIAGVSLKIDKTMPLGGPANIYQRFDGSGGIKNANIRSLSLYADTVYVNDPIRLPGTSVTIYARVLVFRDRGSEISQINTTPNDYLVAAVSPAVTGLSGGRAGDIRIFVREMQGNPRFRFIQVGGKGQNGALSPAIANGNAGDAGDFYSNLDAAAYVDNFGGSGGSGTGSAASISRGLPGRIYNTGDTILWLHYNYLQLVVRYANDLFMLGRTPESQILMNGMKAELNQLFYAGKLFPAYNNSIFQIERAQNGMQLALLSAKMDASLKRINSGLDYFGNPAGWVPLLSNEMLTSIYNSQLDNTMNISYLAELVRGANDALVTLANRKQAVISKLSDKINADNQNINYLFSQNEGLQISIEGNNQKLADLKTELEYLNADLENRARKMKDDAESKALWAGIAKGVGAVCSLIPEPTCQAIGAGLTIGAKLLENPPTDAKGWIKSGIDAFNDIKKAYTKSDYSAEQLKLKNNFNGFVDNGLCIGKDKITCGKEQIERATAIYDSFGGAIDGIIDVVNKTRTGDEQLDGYLAELRAKEPRYGEAINQSKQLAEENTRFLEELNNNIVETQLTANRISQNALAVDALSYQGSIAISKVNMQLVQYMNEMENDEFYRLKKYQYMLAKSWEYRTCTPYPGDMRVDSVFFSIKSLVNAATGTSLNQGQLSALKSLFFTKAVKPMMDALVDELTSPTSGPTNSVEFSYFLTKDDLDKLNTSGSFIFNPLEQTEYFSSSEEDFRIQKFEFDSIIVKKKSGQVFPQNGNVKLVLDYPRNSKIRKNGQVFYFTNSGINRSWPISYEGRVFPAQNNQMGRYAWSEDLQWLCHFLTLTNPTYTCDISRALARPAFWADMLISSEVNPGIPAGDSLIFERVKINFSYSYRPSNNNLKIANIKPNYAWMKPLFVISREDENNRQDGYGEINRIYPKSAALTTAKAPRFYGKYRFVSWKKINGSTTIDTNLTVSFNSNNDAYLTANYIPIEEIIVANGARVAGKLIEKDTLWVNSQMPFGGDTLKIAGYGSGKAKSEYFTDSLVAASNGNLAFRDGNADLRRGYLDSLQVGNVFITYAGNSAISARKLGEIFTFAPDDKKFIHKTIVMQRGISSSLTPPVIQGNASLSICSGQTQVLQVQNPIPGGLYTWSNDSTGTQITVNQAGSYTVSYTSGGQTSAPSAPVLITVNPSPVVNITSSPQNPGNTYCINAAITLSANGANTYVWTPSIIAGQPFTPTLGSTTYRVIGTSNSCSDTSEITITGINPPQAPVISLSGNVLTANPGTNIQWYKDNQPIPGQTGATLTLAGDPGGVYYAIVTNPCNSDASNLIAILGTPVISGLANQNLCSNENPQLCILNPSPGFIYTWNNNQTGSCLPITQNGSYFVTASFAGNNSAPSQSVFVTIRQAPNVAVTASPQTICEGQTPSSTLVAAGAVSYLWSNQSTGFQISVSPTSTTTYSVVGTGANNCNDTASIDINVVSKPVISLINSTLVVTNPQTGDYQWYLNGIALTNATNDTLIPTQDGSYSVKYTGQNCTDLVSESILYTEIQGLVTQSKIRLIPNPSSVFVRLATSVDVKELIFRNSIGVEVFRTNQPNGLIDVSTLIPGVYFVEAQSGERIYQLRFIKN